MGKSMGTDYNVPNVEQLRWDPFPMASKPTDFIDGMHALMGSGDPSTKSGICIYVLSINESMKDKAFCNSDGDFLFVAQEGVLEFQTEFGIMRIEPGEIAVIQRGIRFAVKVEGNTRAYVLEVYDGHFVIPDLGPIGSNGLANPRDFLFPVAAYEGMSLIVYM